MIRNFRLSACTRFEIKQTCTRIQLNVIEVFNTMAQNRNVRANV